MSFSVFDTSFASNNTEILRWTSVGIAGFLTIICLIWGAMIYTKKTFTDSIKQTTGMSETLAPRIVIASLFLITVASTFLSWYVASLHMFQNNLIALDVLNFVIIMFLSISAYMYYKTNSRQQIARVFVGSAVVLEIIALIILTVSPTAAGSNGILTQSALYVPLLIATLSSMLR